MAQTQHVNVSIVTVIQFPYLSKLLFSLPAIDCGPPPQPANSAIQSTTTTFGSIAIYSCNPGYELSTGTATFIRECLGTAEWSGATPSCDSELILE